MKNKILLIIFSSILAFSNNDKKMVEINFNDIKDLDILVRMDIDLDHHRTLHGVHAHVNENQFNTISELGFEIKYIPNQARIYYEELIADPNYSNDPMRSYHNYNELTDFLININSEFPAITNLFSIVQSVQGRELLVL